MKRGEIFNVAITGLTHDGDGVGRIDGLVIFVPNAAPGDLVKVKLDVVKKTWLHGTLLSVVEPSLARTEPWCLRAAECGGCQLQHLHYEAQLEWKEKQVADAMERIAKLKVPIHPIIGMGNPYGYRNKAQFPVGLDQQEVVMGFYRRGSHEIVNHHDCGIQHPVISKLAQAVRLGVAKLNIPPYDEQKHTGVIRHAVIRVSFERNEAMLVLVTRTSTLPKQEELVAYLQSEVPELTSVAHNINPAVTNVIFGPITRHVWGREFLVDSIGETEYAISPRSFFQVNPVQTEVLYETVKEALGLTGSEVLLDLYCGAGTIGLFVAKGVKELYGVEVVEDAISDAKTNAKLNGVEHAHFYVGPAEDVVPELLKRVHHFDAIIVDPPRKGCSEVVLQTIVEASPSRLVYVSCNPATLARDLAYLDQNGFRTEGIQPVDMFPHTSHVECVVLMSRVEK